MKRKYSLYLGNTAMCPQTPSNSSVLFSTFSCGPLRTKFYKDTVFTLALKVFPVHQKAPQDPHKDHLSQVLPGAQAHITCKHICGMYTHMHVPRPQHNSCVCMCVCRVLSIYELMSNPQKSGASSPSVKSEDASGERPHAAKGWV